jgi:hypothetical protein
MAFVKIVASNLFAGQPAKRLTKGTVYDVPDELAEKWVGSGKAKATEKKEGVAIFATPSAFVVEQEKYISGESGISAEEFAAEKKRADEAVDALAALKSSWDEREAAHVTALAEEKKRADEAVDALAALNKKGK